MKIGRRMLRPRTVLAGMLVSVLTLTSCSGGGPSGGSGNTIKVAYGSDYVFLTPDLADKWWKKVAADFKASNPGADVQFIPIPGGFSDIVSKLNLLYRNPQTAPDVAELPNDQLGGWVTSGYLHELDDYVGKADWWSRFPDSVKAASTFDGHVYSVNHGENTNALYYNIPMFTKAGLPVPWHPKTWADVLAAAQKIHDTQPDVWPLWLVGGNAGGTSALQFSGGNLLMGASNNTIFDAQSKKWTVDSPGLRETFGFYSDLGKKQLQAPSAQLLDPNAIVNSFKLMADQKAAIAVSGNFLGSSWVKDVCQPCFAGGPQTYGVVELPTVNGTGNPNTASVLGGWDLSIGADTKNADLAWKFIESAQTPENMVNAATGGGWVPPDKSLWSDPRFANFAPPYQEFFANILPAAKAFPSNPDFAAWATGFGMATGKLIQDPSTSVDDAINTMKQYVTGQLGSDKVQALS
jgi:multiple sugar transport system substrate-binding protein